MRIHRVGTLTLGCILILFGVLFLFHLFVPGLTYDVVFRMWPVILIMLGGETLYCSRRYEDFQYDFGAVMMTLLLGFLTVCMAASDLLFRWAAVCGGIAI